MTSENIEYFAGTIAQMPTGVVAFLVMFRTVFNLHPIFTGLAAARLASFIWIKDPETRLALPPKTISVCKVIQAVVPSMLMHALFDFGLMFTSANTESPGLDTLFVATSLTVIPVSIGLLVVTYRQLPYIGPQGVV